MVSLQRFNELEERTIKLDKKDNSIISILLQNSRMAFTKMAKEVMLSKDAVKYRITKLQEKGLFLCFFPQLDYQMLGYEEFKVRLLLDEAKKERQKELIESAMKNPNVQRIVEYSDRWDVEISVLAKDMREFDEIDLQMTKLFKDVILQKDKIPIVKHYLKDCCPFEFGQDASFIQKLKEIQTKPKEKIKIDEKDLLIIKELTENSRQSTYEIHPRVKLSADAVGLRIKRLQKAGVIEKFTIALNYSMLGYHFYSFEADLSALDKESEAKLMDFSISHPFIFSAKKTMGYYDVIFKLTTKHAKNLHLTIDGIKEHFAEAIRDYETLIGFREVYFNPFPSALLQ